MTTARAKVPAHGLGHRRDTIVRASRATILRAERARARHKAGQLVLDFEEGQRSEVRQALLEVGQDPRPDQRFARSRVCKRAVRLFPQGMTLAEVGFVLGMHKQSVKKLEMRALAKLAAVVSIDREAVLAMLADADARRDHWDALEEQS